MLSWKEKWHIHRYRRWMGIFWLAGFFFAYIDLEFLLVFWVVAPLVFPAFFEADKEWRQEFLSRKKLI